MPIAICLMKKTRADAEGEEDDGDRQRGGGDHAAGAADADRDRLLVAVAEVVLLLDPRHHQHRVVGGEAEDHGEEEDEAGHLDRRRAGVVERRVEPAVLEGEDEDAERRAEGQRVHQQRLQRQQDRAGEQEEQDQGGEADDRDDQRRVFDQALLLVDEAGGVAGDQRGRRAPGGARSRIACTESCEAPLSAGLGEGEVGVGDLAGGADEGGAADDAVDRFDPALEGGRAGPGRRAPSTVTVTASVTSRG